MMDLEIPLVRDYMDKNFVRLRPDQDVFDAIELFLKQRITGAAVVDEAGQVVGILSEKDVLATLVESAFNSVPRGVVSQYMSEVVMTVPPTMDVITVAETFLKQVFRRLLVVENGVLIGQITRRDLLRAVQVVVQRKDQVPVVKAARQPGVRVSALDRD